MDWKSLRWSLSTADTKVDLFIQDGKLWMAYLGTGFGANWAREPAKIQFPARLDAGRIRTAPIWEFESARETAGAVDIAFRDRNGGARIRSVWTAFDGPGPVVHQLFLDNSTENELAVYAPQSLHAMLGAGAQTDVFYVHKDRMSAQLTSGMRSGCGTYRERLEDRYEAQVWTKTDDDDTGFVPLVMLHTEQNEGVYIGWKGNHGRIAVQGVLGVTLRAEIRAGPFDEFCTDVQPGESLELPAVFVGAFTGDLDDGSNRLRKWLFEYGMPEINRRNESLPYVNGIVRSEAMAETHPSHPLPESACDSHLETLAEAGVEEVTLDAGWWEKPGDWRGHRAGWPGGIERASRLARDRGMAFSLTFSFVNGESQDPDALSAEWAGANPDWFMDHLKADFGVAECVDFIRDRLETRLHQYGASGLRTDGEPVVNRKAHANPHHSHTDVAYWSERGFLRLLDRLYETRPDLRYRNDSGGGALKGYAVMARSTAVSATDSCDALDVRKAVWDSAYAFPMMQIETGVGDPREGDGLSGYWLRTWLMSAPSACLPVSANISPDEKLQLNRLIAAYKEKVRPLVRHANVYHNLPRPDGVSWDGIEYYDPAAGRGLTMLFKPDSDADTQTVGWKGLEAEAYFDVSFFDGTNPPVRLQGKELMERGLAVTLQERFVSEWIFIDRVPGVAAGTDNENARSERSDLRLDPLFSDGMVLQRGKPLPVWGKGTSGATVRVECRGEQAEGVVRDGRWQVVLPPMPEGGPYQMTVESGDRRLLVRDVWFGDVWLAGGQSNMLMSVEEAQDAPREIAAADHPLIRYYDMPDINFDDGKEHAGTWKMSSPENAGKFSAVAYHFAVQLTRAYGIPIGIIGCSKGATSASCWMSEETLRRDPQLRAFMDEYDQAVSGLDLEIYYEQERRFHAEIEPYFQRERAGLTGEALGEPPPFPPMGPRNFLRPCGMYEMKLRPAAPYALKGFIYYQGEGDAGRAELYDRILGALIDNWRRTWNDPSLPFLFVQLPGFGCSGNPDGIDWALLRESQAIVSERVPGTGMAVSLDCGDFDEIHPPNKKPVGERLALLARERVYGEPVAGSSPQFQAMRIVEGRASLTFAFCDGGLQAAGPVRGFEIAGANGRFVPADAEIRGDGQTIEAWHADIAAPATVRYGFRNWTDANVTGGGGLPLGTFRTDRRTMDETE